MKCNKKIFSLILVCGFVSCSALAASEKNESNAKICLASIYGAESSYFKQHKKYADHWDALGITKDTNPNCSAKELSFKVSASGFKVDYKVKGSHWSINEKKVIVNEGKL